MNSFTEIFSSWPSLQDLAEDVGASSLSAVKVWRHRNMMPASYDVDLVSAAKKRKIPGVTFEKIALIRHLNRKKP